MLDFQNMCQSAKRLRDIYSIKPDAHIVQKEFGFYCLERWTKEGHINEKTNLGQLFGYEEWGGIGLGGLGWCEAGFCPTFPEIVLEDRGGYELVQDFAGRSVLFFKGRRNGFMPEYVDHPVKDMKSWLEKCKWRMDPSTPERFTEFDKRMEWAKDAEKKGKIITCNMVGGYMYLRSLAGPVDLLYMFYDDPGLIHECMKTWFELADSIIEKYQQHVTIDEYFIGEDICYNHGPLISPDMIKEFLFPYYRQIMTNIKKRQIDKSRHLYFQVDTDGYANSVVDLYRSIGMDVMSPFEVASGCDVVEVAKKYPDLVITGGIDKRILAEGKEAIDRHLDHIMPFMKKRGGYIPTCDHGVPEEVSFENYMYFRKLMLEYAD